MSRPKAPAPKKPPKTPEQEKQAAKNREQYRRHREKILGKAKAAYARKTQAEILEKRWRDIARPTPHSDRNHHRSAMAQATCEWIDAEEVFRLYMAAAVMTELTGESYEVDHLVPLRSPLVCGLHTHGNLGVVTVSDNRFKGSWAWPDMWEYDWKTVQELQDLRKKQQENL